MSGAIFECSNIESSGHDSVPGEVGVGGGAGELVVEERSVDFSEDELVAHGAVGHHAEGVVDDAAVAGPSQSRGRPACVDRQVNQRVSCVVGYRQM